MYVLYTKHIVNDGKKKKELEKRRRDIQLLSSSKTQNQKQLIR